MTNRQLILNEWEQAKKKYPFLVGTRFSLEPSYVSTCYRPSLDLLQISITGAEDSWTKERNRYTKRAKVKTLTEFLCWVLLHEIHHVYQNKEEYKGWEREYSLLSVRSFSVREHDNNKLEKASDRWATRQLKGVH